VTTIPEINAWLKSLLRQRRFTYLDYYSAMADEKGAETRPRGRRGFPQKPRLSRHGSINGKQPFLGLRMENLLRARQTRGKNGYKAPRTDTVAQVRCDASRTSPLCGWAQADHQGRESQPSASLARGFFDVKSMHQENDRSDAR
jgi:hypothetical protein